MKALTRYTLLLAMLLSTPFILQAQSAQGEDVKAVIEQLFEGMKKSDSTLVAASFKSDAIMQTIAKDQSGKVSVRNSELQNFLNSISQAEVGLLNEKIISYEIKVDGELASVWTPYEFSVGDRFSHCGVNSFQLVKEEGSWKIFHIVDTRRKDNCVEG